MNTLETLDLTHSFFQLGPDFYQIKNPDPVDGPHLVNFNPDAASLIGLAPAEAQRVEFAEYFGGNRLLPGCQPLAMVYSGHQFGVYNPQLGDGRGLLLGEVRNESGSVWDIHLKGCGPTRFSRGFDGRATLRSSIREYLGAEALHGLGIPTTRSLALIGIRDLVYRELPEPGAILARLSESHIRFGSFQHFHFTNSPEKVARLVDYAIRRHFPELEREADKHRLFYRAVVEKTARLIALWQSVGFVHGVMNTDNMTVNGVTFDYGPFGFLDWFNPAFSPNSSDAHGRYAYGQQPVIAQWNLHKLGETLCHLAEPGALLQELAAFQHLYNGFSRELMGRKLGLSILDAEFNGLVGRLFKLLHENQMDYTLFFRSLSGFPAAGARAGGCKNLRELDDWLRAYRRLIEREDPDLAARQASMDRANPRFILRNYLLQRAVERALKESDFSEVERLRILLRDPYAVHPEIFARHGIDADFYAAATPDALTEMQLSCSA